MRPAKFIVTVLLLVLGAMPALALVPAGTGTSGG